MLWASEDRQSFAARGACAAARKCRLAGAATTSSAADELAGCPRRSKFAAAANELARAARDRVLVDNPARFFGFS